MRLSARSEYGLRALAALAERAAAEPVPLRQLANKEGLSEQFLEQIFVDLRRGGFVVSTRGAHGGYSLARPADEILIFDLLETLEGDLAPYECVATDQPECTQVPFCVTRQVWVKLRESMQQAIGSMTLAEMAGTPSQQTVGP